MLFFRGHALGFGLDIAYGYMKVADYDEAPSRERCGLLEVGVVAVAEAEFPCAFFVVVLITLVTHIDRPAGRRIRKSIAATRK